MKQVLPLFFVLTALAGSLALPQSSTPPTKPAAKKTAAKKSKAAKKPAGVTAATWRNRQMEPTPDRYKQIQQALVDKGYLKSEPNGVWDAESSAALLQFQNDKKLSPTGKISAASLIALGLGPQTSSAAQVQPPAAAPEHILILR